MKKFTLFSLAVFGLFFSSKAQTTSANTSQTVTLNLQNQIEIAVLSATGTSFTFASTADYTSGLTNASASQLQVKSNKAWTVTVKAGAADFTGPTGNQMPASALGVRINGGSSFTQLSTTAANLTTGSRGSNTFTVDYNANPGFNYDAGSYTLNVIYTATQQ